MSHWSEIEGTVTSKKLSVKRVVKSLFDGQDYTLTYSNEGYFRIAFESDGDSAIQMAKELISAIQSFDPAAVGEFEFHTLMYFGPAGKSKKRKHCKI